MPFRIHHRALTDNFRSLHAALARNPDTCWRWSSSVGLDPSSKDNLARLMLKASLLSNPTSVILFSSKEPRHIQADVLTAADSSLDSSARRLHQLVQAERNQIMQQLA
jgi:D-threo-aldose 1-dehydrogenase